MWVIAGLLLGIVVLAAILGFHTGPHAHLVAGAAGIVAAAWLVVMAIEGRSSSVLWTIFTADLLISAGVGLLAWRALASGRKQTGQLSLTQGMSDASRLEGLEGTVVKDLMPEGVVRVRGEEWTATAANGNAPTGSRVHVMSVEGMRLEVWVERAEAAESEHAPAGRRDVSTLFQLEHIDEKNEEAAP
jgi:membrane-bound serine protease (ClpP class)